MVDPITQQEKQDLKKILGYFYGNIAKDWTITLRTFEVFGELLENTKACDRMMDFIPRPFGGGNVINWAVKQVPQAVLRFFRKPEAKHYIICMKTVALRMRTKFEMAQHGI